MKQTLDFYTIGLERYLQRYYSEYDLTNWNRWMERIIKPLYNGDFVNWKRMDYNYRGISNQGKYEYWFKERQKKMIEADSNLQQQLNLDPDIILFISYLVGLNFFDDIDLTVEEWLNSKKINQTGKHAAKKEKYSINEISQFEYGSNLIRDKLISLDWHNQ